MNRIKIEKIFSWDTGTQSSTESAQMTLNGHCAACNVDLKTKLIDSNINF